MSVTISQKDYWDLIYQTRCQQNLNHNDKFDITYQYPEQLGQGTYREIKLRQGVELSIDCCQVHKDVIVEIPERSHPVEYRFKIAEKSTPSSIPSKQYLLCGSGIAPSKKLEKSIAEPIMEIDVHIEPKAFQTFLGDCELASMGLERLIRPSDRFYYTCWGATSITMQTILYEILYCPFQGITKKIYLESTVWKLMALLLEEERKRHQDKDSVFTLKSEDIDRIHYAKEILATQLDNPPSLLDLARQVGLNDYILKRGFREVFGMTAFGYLHQQRMEYARLLLLQEDLNVGQIAKKIGYASQSRFAAAFRKKFGVNPKAFTKQF